MSELNEDARSFGLSVGDHTDWRGLRVERVGSFGPNWVYRVQAGDRDYRTSIFNPDPKTFRFYISRKGGTVVWQRVDAATPEDALSFVLEIIRRVRELGWPVHERQYAARHAFASFNLYGYAMNLDRITEATGLRPTGQLPAPDVLQLTDLGPWRNGFWSLQSGEEVDSLDLQDHVRWLLDRIEPAGKRLPNWQESWDEWDRSDDPS